MEKHTFSEAERYAVWLHHAKRCWLCTVPLELIATTVDHVIPESLMDNPVALQNAIELYGLPASFNVNGFENWLPAHSHCNQAKGGRELQYVPAQRFIFEKLLDSADRVERTAIAINKRGEKGKVLAKLLTALDNETLSVDDVDAALEARVTSRPRLPVNLAPDDFIRLDTGYWIRRDEIAYEGQCQCERQTCVGWNGKVHCLFSKHLSRWVIESRLYWKCYDEEIECPRCQMVHKRGHVGREGRCSKAYTDQN